MLCRLHALLDRGLTSVSLAMAVHNAVLQKRQGCRRMPWDTALVVKGCSRHKPLQARLSTAARDHDIPQVAFTLVLFCPQHVP